MKRYLSCASAGALLLAGLCFPVVALGSDVSIYSVAKGIYFEQISTAAPMALTNNGYVFLANVAMSAAGTVGSASIQPLGQTSDALTADGDELDFKKKYNTRAKLDSNYPNGNFVLTLNTVHDGNRSITLPLQGDLYPNAPRIINLSEVQQVNAAGYLLIRWERMANGTASDFIQLRIEDSTGDKVFETPDFGEGDALNCEATSTLITPGTLRANTTYEGTLLFQKNVRLDQSSYPGALGAASYFARTSFRLATSSAGEPDAESYELTKGRTFVQADTATPVPDDDKPYSLEAKVHGSAAGLVTGSSLLTPFNNSLALTGDNDLEDFEYEGVATSAGLLESSYPSGNYTFSINTVHDGTRSPGISLPAPSYPPAPHLNNFNPSVEIRANQDLALQWDGWADGTANDFIQLRIEDKDGDKIFETPDFTKKDALNGHATRVVVPAGTLLPDKSYKGRLVFQKIAGLDTSAYSGALGVAGFWAKTKFDIDTAPADIKTFTAFKGHEFVQRDTSAPRLNVSTAFVFTASVEADSSGSVNDANIITPNGASVPLRLQADGKTFLLLDGCEDQAMVNAAYPDGTYRLQINTAHEGVVNLGLTISGAAYPNAPHLLNFAGTQMVNASNALTLSWDGFSGGTAEDFISLEIADANGTAFATKSYGKSSALNGTATSVTIPPNTLVANHLYKGRLLFQKVLVVDTSTYPGADGLAGYFARTQFTLTTAGPNNPPRLSSMQVATGGQMKFVLGGLAGADYRIDCSTNLLQWVPLRTISTTQGETEFFDGVQGPCCFYRAMFVP